MLTPEQNIFLASSEAFQALLNDDPVLTELEASSIDLEKEKLILFEALGGTERICGMDVQPFTPAVFSVLWTLKSPLCSNGREASALDAAIALWLLTHPLNQLDYSTIEQDAAEYAKSITADWNDVWMELVSMVSTAFSPLKMLPEAPADSSEPPVFDVDWLLSVCSVAARESGETLQHVAVNFPLSMVHGLMVICARKANPGACYRKHTPEFVGKRMMERVAELSEQFLKENHPEV